MRNANGVVHAWVWVGQIVTFFAYQIVPLAAPRAP